ncbi:MAG: NTP transferase domain-containing protein [Deltaproteobacteria bacterium]|mgnify:CR=1 FL=1|nr:NTP transferase domain-containing protein [Deltaproteobacteria bacterium]
MGDTTRKLASVILAAGKGTRMKSDLAKVLHPLCGKPMLHYPIALARAIGSKRIVPVVGHQAEEIQRLFSDDDLTFALQREQLGTAHAVLQAKAALHDFVGDVVILCGDVPLLLPSTVESLVDHHRSHNAAITVVTTFLADPGSYGRVIRGEGDTVVKIVEARDATEKEKEINEINTGIYCAERKFLFESLDQIGNENSQGEYYLTDIFEIAGRENRNALPFVVDDSVEAMGINTVSELQQANEIMKKRGDGQI